jgi:hypothetical protein
MGTDAVAGFRHYVLGLERVPRDGTELRRLAIEEIDDVEASWNSCTNAQTANDEVRQFINVEYTG